MSNDDSFRGGPRRPGGGFKPRGDGPRPAGPPRDAGERPRKPFFRDGDAPRGPRRDFGDAPKRDFSAGPRREGDAPRGPRRDFGDGPKRDFAGPRREGGDAPRRSFDGPRDFRRDGDAPRGPRRDFGDAPKRDFSAGPRRDGGDAPRRSFGDAPKRDFSAGPRREGGDAPRRSFDGPRDFRRDGDAPRGPRRDFGDGPKRDFSAGPRREGSDAPRRSFDGPRDFRRDGDAPRGPRRDFGDGPKRDFSAGPRREGGDAPRRSFDGPRDFRRDGDAPRGPRRDFGNGPKRDFGTGPRRDGGDAPRRSFDGPRDFRRDGDAPRGPRRDFGDAPRRSHDGPGRDHAGAQQRDFHREAPARTFFREEPATLNAESVEAATDFESMPVSPAQAPVNDDWEISLGEQDGSAAPASADAWPSTDADQMPEAEDHTAPLPAAADTAEPAAPLAPPEPRGADYSRRDTREDFRRPVERGDSRGFDNDARRAQRQREVRIHGANACAAVVRDRRDAVRKVYLRHDRAEDFAALLEWCRAQHLAYRYVTDSELSALTGSEHHEGICLEIERKPFLAFETLLNQLKLDHGAKVLLLLDGVGNPHNIGGILRAAAHFGVHALLLPPDSSLQLSAATYRTAEGGAELVPIVKLRELGRDLEALGALDFHVIGSFPREATSIHTTRWPERTLLVIGAEQDGIRPATEALCDRRFTIPGSGAVESLNAATAAAVLLSAYAGSLARESWAASKS